MTKQLLRDMDGNPIGTIEELWERKPHNPYYPHRSPMPRTDNEWSLWWLKGKEQHVRPQEGVSYEAWSWAFSGRIDELNGRTGDGSPRN